MLGHHGVSHAPVSALENTARAIAIGIAQETDTARAVVARLGHPVVVHLRASRATVALLTAALAAAAALNASRRIDTPCVACKSIIARLRGIL